MLTKVQLILLFQMFKSALVVYLTWSNVLDKKESSFTFADFDGVMLIFRGQLLWAGGVPQTSDKHSRDIPFLDKYALERWEVRWLFMLLIYLLS